MIAILGQLWGFLLVVALLGAAAGWSWADARARPRWRTLDEERRRLRADLLSLAAGQRPGAGGPEQMATRRRVAELEQALAEARGRGAEADVLRLRVAELERAHAAQPKPVGAVDVTDYTSRIGALEFELEAARLQAKANEGLAARVAELEAAAQARPSQQEVDLADLKWRLHVAEALAEQGAPAGGGERVAQLEKELEAARTLAASAQALEARIKQLESAPPPASEDELTELRWRNRYLNERVRYLESAPAAAPLPAAPSAEEQEQADRRKWRMRYFEQRALYLESQRAALAAQLAAAPGADETAALKARAAGLERQLAEALARPAAAPEAEQELTRARWKARYLDARVRYLEGRIGALAAAPEAGEAMPPAPAPRPAPGEVFRLERPAALSAPRGGAPDDLRLISGVSAQAQATLNAIGVFHFDQLAAWTPAHVAWVDQYLNLRGRIDAERWVEQARALARDARAASLADQAL
jgi:predicted flap endonuclease-1-like 5' DNA nuclease